MAIGRSIFEVRYMVNGEPGLQVLTPSQIAQIAMLLLVLLFSTCSQKAEKTSESTTLQVQGFT